MRTDAADITQLLDRAASGDQPAANQLMPLVYDDLRRVAGGMVAREGRGLTLQPTELVHEAYFRLVGQTRVDWQGRTHFLAVGAQAMRRILVDRARARNARKRGGKQVRVELREQDALSVNREEDVLAIEAALEKLEALDPRQAKIVELRFFGGLTGEEIAQVLGLSRGTVQTQWRVIRAWLRRELGEAT